MGSSIESEDLTTPSETPCNETSPPPLESIAALQPIKVVTRRPSPPHAKPGPQPEETEIECPVCCMFFCEPVITPCQHRFCLNCLGKVQRIQGHGCPICRTQCMTPAEDLPRDGPLEESLKILDPEYAEKLREATQEREQMLAQLSMPRMLNSSGVHHIEVSGGGSREANGTYVSSYLWSYSGPPLFQKPNTRMFLFRWQQRHWILANLSQNERFNNKSMWYYKANSGGQDIPVQHGWGLIANGCGVLPAPELIIVYGEQTMQPRRIRNEETEAGAGSHEDQVPHPNQCIRCSIM